MPIARGIGECTTSRASLNSKESFDTEASLVSWWHSWRLQRWTILDIEREVEAKKAIAKKEKNYNKINNKNTNEKCASQYIQGIMMNNCVTYHVCPDIGNPAVWYVCTYVWLRTFSVNLINHSHSLRYGMFRGENKRNGIEHRTIACRYNTLAMQRWKSTPCVAASAET